MSVVIPALNEQTTIGRALESTRLPRVERIVVDGGPTDGTPASALALGAEKVVLSKPGRALQMDAGYRQARADTVLFLHADSALQAGWLDALERALADPRVAGGAFRLRFDAPGRGWRLVEGWVRVRSRLLRLPFGDQALFVRRKLLDAAGGIAPVSIFEDLDLVRLIRGSGALALLPEHAHTSTRRYERNGVARQMLRNQLALAAWSLRLDRERVARWYRGRPSR